MIECDNCHRPFEPVATRWLCPHCKFKASCCEGQPLVADAVPTAAPATGR